MELNPVRRLQSAGRFAEALKMLNGLSFHGDRLPMLIMKAELLERVGEPSQGRFVAEGLLKKQGLSSSDKSACEIVLALLDSEQFRVESTIAHLQRAVGFAKQAKDLEKLAWAQLRLLLVVSDSTGPGSVGPLINEARDSVVRLG